jgi:methyl-accepting chemotaxis protein
MLFGGVTQMDVVKKKVGIIGGGKVGLTMFNLFHGSQLSEVIYVVDINASAPAREAARAAGVPDFDNMDRINRLPADFIVEVTGAQKVVERLNHIVEGTSQQIITHDMAYIVMQVLEEGNHRASQSVKCEIGQIHEKMDKSLQTIEDLVDNIGAVTSEMRILAINARIEAARAGEQGRGFAVVSAQMAKAVDSIQNIAVQIEKVNQVVHGASNKIQTTIDDLN